MTRYRYVLLFILCMILFPNISKAECSYERQAELSRIASNVQFSYSYEMVNEMPVFTINITNVTSDVYLMDAGIDEIVPVDGERSFTYEIDNFTFQYDIYSNDSSCYGEYILTKYITLPKYNFFSNTEECKSNPSFKYCGMWVKVPLNSEQFSKELEKYKASKNATKGVESKTSVFDVLLLHKNTIIVCLCMILFLLVVLFIKKVGGGKCE